MLKVIRRLNLAQQSFAHSDVMQRISRAQRSIGQNSMVRQLALAPRSIGRRMLTSFAIALASAAMALLAGNVPPIRGSIERINFAIYDGFFKNRPQVSKLDGPIVIIAVDDSSVKRMFEATENRFPWPRMVWGNLVSYLEKCGAKVVAFDLKFDEPSWYNRESTDDKDFAAVLDATRMPVIQAGVIDAAGAAPPFLPPITKPARFGAVNVIDANMIRTYASFVKGKPSLAVQTLSAIGQPIPDWAGAPFYLHYYGPNKRPAGENTFRYVPAFQSVLLAQEGAAPVIEGLSADTFRGKVVLIGLIKDALHDLKSSPYSDIFPGVEAHATAISNLLENRRVHPLGQVLTFNVSLLGALLAAGGAVVLRKPVMKVIVSLAAVFVLYAAANLLFVHWNQIYWLPLAGPLLATILATAGGLGWTYIVEDRQRRVLRKFLAQYVSPDVAQRLDEIGTVSLGGVRRELSLLFTDIAGFTDLSEQLDSEQLEKFMNFYLSQMSDVVFSCNGTLDKYIGDAIMAFWNAPLDQPDHAQLICRTALRMHQREEAIRPELAAMGAAHIHTRIGVHTGLANVGNYGSLQKLNYTVLGDNVNLASRLEGANKLYGSSILVGQPTVEKVQGKFLFRQLDLLRVKGKKKPMAVYELMAEGAGDAGQQRLAKDYTQAFTAYQKQQWDEARCMLLALGDSFPTDGPIAALLKRVEGFRSSPPPADWDGVYIAKDK